MKNVFTLFFLVFALICTIVAVGCINTSGKEILPGFLFYDAPVEANLGRPGLIFRVDDRGVKFNVTQLAVTPDGSGRVEPKSKEQIRTIKTKTFFNFLKLDTSRVVNDLNLDLESKVTFKVKLGESRIETLSDFAIDNELQKVIPLIQGNRAMNKTRQKDKYFLIRESVLAKRMEYGFNKDVINAFGIDIPIAKVMKLNSNSTWNNKNEYQLSFDYPEPMRVFYKVEQLEILSSVTGQQTIVRKEIDGQNINSYFNQ